MCILSHNIWKLLKMSHLIFFLILAFFSIFCPIENILSGNTFRPLASGFQKLAKMDHFYRFLSTQNVNARNVEWDFFCDFQTPWILTQSKSTPSKSNLSKKSATLSTKVLRLIGSEAMSEYAPEPAFHPPSRKKEKI